MLTEHTIFPRTYFLQPQYEAMVIDHDDDGYSSYPFGFEDFEEERRRALLQDRYQQDYYDQMIKRQREIEE